MIPADRITFNDDGTLWVVFGDDDNERQFFPAEWVTDLDRPCDQCEGLTIEVEGCVCDVEHGYVDSCPGNQWHRVSVIPGMVLPIVADLTARSLRDEPFIWKPSHRWAEMFRTGESVDHSNITLPPAAKPGMYAVQLVIHV